MANNRMWLKCTACPDAPRFFLGKYYPSTGWYTNRTPERLQQLGFDLEQWLDEHKHKSFVGAEIVMEKEA